MAAVKELNYISYFFSGVRASDAQSSGGLTQLNSYGGTCIHGIPVRYSRLWSLLRGAQRDFESVLHSRAAAKSAVEKC